MRKENRRSFLKNLGRATGLFAATGSVMAGAGPEIDRAARRGATLREDVDHDDSQPPEAPESDIGSQEVDEKNQAATPPEKSSEPNRQRTEPLSESQETELVQEIGRKEDEMLHDVYAYIRGIHVNGIEVEFSPEVEVLMLKRIMLQHNGRAIGFIRPEFDPISKMPNGNVEVRIKTGSRPGQRKDFRSVALSESRQLLEREISQLQ